MDIIGIIGAGTMGAGIAQVAASHGHNVVLYDVQAPLAQRGLDRITQALTRAVEKQKIDRAELEATLSHLWTTTDLADMSTATIVIEAVPEDLALKRDLFRSLDHLCCEETVLCSNTSSLSITALGGATQRPDRVAGLHFFNPAPIMPLIEVVRGDRTSDDTISRLIDLARRWGKTPVVAKDTPGFIVNRVARPFYGEALRLLDQRVADVATIDRIVRAAGFKMGPFELLDLIGLDVNFAVTQSIYTAYFQEPRFKPHPIQQRMVDANALGRKTGRGFYDYSADPQP
ncbi:MAG TPA: 3-hydroxyacyl-CoA dehydrogenase NAD-binding domain-containing protein, partial [Anaerolineae bacterium]|nr:3-hydroxyacyl-CoA dehydrogenase NAD-binding domain-containing protein [Anaerolineae bacterium]